MKQRKTILVCDDDEGISELLKTILEEANFKVQVLSNGKGIQKAVKEFSPSLILLDVWMPGIKGQEVIKILKRDPEAKKIPIILISALNEISKISKQTEADDFIPKPFDIEDLLKKVRKYI